MMGTLYALSYIAAMGTGVYINGWRVMLTDRLPAVLIGGAVFMGIAAFCFLAAHWAKNRQLSQPPADTEK